MMFGKIMSLPDRLMAEYFELCTYTSETEVAELTKKLNNPRDLKLRLAREIVAIYHGEMASQRAEVNFINTFSKKIIPADMPVVAGGAGEKLSEVLVRAEVVESKTEFRRLVKDGAIYDLDTDESVADPEVMIKNNWRLKIGKKRFVRITIG